jgi:glucokinase
MVKERGMIGAIDIGGTKIAVGLVGEQGHILSQSSFPTEAQGGFANGVERMRSSLADQLAQRDQTLRGIGVGCTGPVNPFNGRIENADLLPGWEGADLCGELSRAFNVSTAMENDADAAALGEFAWGAGKDSTRFIYVTISTGIGSGTILDGRLYRGVDGSHPEVGHHILDPNGPLCYCTAHGCWEMLASGTALADFYNAQLPEGSPHLDARRICGLAESGDTLACQALEREAFYLGLGLANLVTLFVPEVISLGGGVIKSWHLFSTCTLEVMRANARLVPVEKVRLEPARLGADTGLIGAAQVWAHRYS